MPARSVGGGPLVLAFEFAITDVPVAAPGGDHRRHGTVTAQRPRNYKRRAMEYQRSRESGAGASACRINEFAAELSPKHYFETAWVTWDGFDIYMPRPMSRIMI